MENNSGYTIESLTSEVDARYADYYDENGKTYVLTNISFGGNDGAAVTDTTVISGDNVNDDGEKLYITVYFNYGSSEGT